MRRMAWIWWMAGWGVWVGCGSGAMREGAPAPAKLPALQPFDNGAFALRVPKGWHMKVAGDCSTLAFVLEDPTEPLRKVVYFGTVGPVYLSAMQKQTDYQYMAMGGFPVEWQDMPVVEPLTPENLLANFSGIAASQVAQRFMPGCPAFDGFQVVSSQPQQPGLSAQGARGALVRGVFAENGRAGEGLFSLTTAVAMPMLGGPGGGTGKGYLMAGITAPAGELAAWQPLLMQVLSSFTIHPEYVRGCLARSQAAFEGVMAAGNTLRETSVMIHQSWENRNRSDDIVSAKRSDAILGRERLYDPGTGEVFEFENGFSDRYRVNPQDYRNPNLEPLPPDNHELWTAPTRDGPRELGF